MGLRSSQTGPVLPEVPCWYAIHTRHQHETVVQKQLEYERIDTYLPLVSEVRQWSDRKKRITVPLFSCFVFIRTIYSPQIHQSVIQKPGVLGFVGIGRQGSPIPELRDRKYPAVVGEQHSLIPLSICKHGQRVRIRGGALDSIEGIVVSNTGRKFIVFFVDTIQRSVAVQLEDSSYRIEVIPVCSARGRRIYCRMTGWGKRLE